MSISEVQTMNTAFYILCTYVGGTVLLFCHIARIFDCKVVAVSLGS